MPKMMIIVAGAGLLVSVVASAMHISYSASVVGFSKDGSAVLLEIRGGGPEGGGTRDLQLRESDGALMNVTTSNDLSPGDGSRPQQIQTSECVAATRPLVARLAQLGFEGVAVGPNGCGIARAGTPGRSLLIKMDGAKATILDGDKSVAQLVVAGSKPRREAEAFASVTGRALVVLGFDFEPVLAFYAGPGGLRALVRVGKK